VRAAELLADGITEVVGVPAVFHAMLAAVERRGVDLHGSALRLCICGGAPLPLALQDRWFEATGVELRQGYGLTEAGPVCLFNRVDRPNVRGSLGYAFPDVDVAVRDRDSGDPIPIGAEGEICVRGDNVFAGYVRDGERGLARRGGWLHTGDLGVMSADGAVTFTGLCKPMFTRNGFNVYPRELERVVGAMPGVRAVVVRAIPSAAREHDIRLEVEGEVTPAEVTAWCEARLSAYKRPSEVVVGAGRP
jgi:long-chain acyl-CoA synthetase